MADRPIQVYVLEGQPLLRDALAIALPTRGLALAGASGSWADAQAQIPTVSPDVVVLDVATPGAGGLEAARWLREHQPRAELVALSVHAGTSYQREAFEAGVRGYVLKDAGLEGLLDAIRCAARGDFYLAGTASPEAAEYATPWVTQQRAGGHITPRERELAVLLADGYSSKEAAARLNISVRTADTHRASLMRKLDARNLADVVKYCIRNGLVDT
ncbi:MAG: response regulator transcription factor [Anaeromyxobacter sp.]